MSVTDDFKRQRLRHYHRGRNGRPGLSRPPKISRSVWPAPTPTATLTFPAMAASMPTAGSWRSSLRSLPASFISKRPATWRTHQLRHSPDCFVRRCEWQHRRRRVPRTRCSGLRLDNRLLHVRTDRFVSIQLYRFRQAFTENGSLAPFALFRSEPGCGAQHRGNARSL